MIENLFKNLTEESLILISVAIMLIAGFLITRLTKLLKLPNVSGYIIAGILIGPSVLKLVPQDIINGMGFISDIALAFIAFGVGKFFKKETLKNVGAEVVVITLFEALTAGAIVTLVMLLFNIEWKLALLLGAIATATAPASTMMTIKQYHAHGEFVDTLLPIVALDDVVCLFAFSIVSAVIESSSVGKVTFASVGLPILYNVLALLLGFVLGMILSKLLRARSQDNRLILVVAMLLGLTGLCSIVNISPLLSCMLFGATYINKTKDKQLYFQIDNFTPPIMSMFFILAGMNLDVKALASFGLIGLVYFVVRIIGKYIGAYAGCAITKTSKKVRNYLGVALIPQAGVSIGLAYLGQRMLPEAIGNVLLTIILTTSVLYELIGPVSAKFALMRACEFDVDESKSNEIDKTLKVGKELELK
ncbi:MAG: cation:proton antiporter [Clostridia bacterium]